MSIKRATPIERVSRHSILNAIVLLAHILQHNPELELIHARTNYAAAVCGYVRLFKRFMLIWDCRGDEKAEIQGSQQANSGAFRKLITPYKLFLARWWAFRAESSCQKAIFVTEALRNLHKASMEAKPYEIIPSVAPDNTFEFNRRLREKMRRELGYSNDDIVIVYSGGMAYYQLFPESVALFSQLLQMDARHKFLALTPATEQAAAALGNLSTHSYKIISASRDKVNAYLNAADYAIMLREHNPLNHAAFPTKFAEYCLVGLPIIMQDSVPEAFAIAKKVGNLCEYRAGTVTFAKPFDRARVSREYQSMLTRSAVEGKFRRLYLGSS